MDPSPKHHPVLSYVMSRFDTKLHLGSKPTTDDDEVLVDVDEPPLPPEQLIKKMPHLNHPKVLSSMTQAIFEVSQTRSLLHTLGDRPDHEAVSIACEKITEIESTLSKQLQKIVLVPRPDNVDRMEWRDQQAEKEKDCRQVAEKEKCIYKSVVHLEEMHEAYEKLLKDAEERLVKIYGSAAQIEEEGEEIGSWDNVELGEEKVNEDVVGTLQIAVGKGLEKVELSERNLKFRPEAFGRLNGLIVLDLSCNRLEVIPDSIAGLEKLEEFNLSSNILESLPDSIGLLFNLKILDVSRNKLKSLPNSISRCRSLVELDASFNALTYLPTNIGHELIHLKRLSIQLNKIRLLPTSVCDMASLCHLDAHFNELHGLPFAIGKLTNLKTLNLSNNFNDMTKLPDTFGDITNLRELDLGNNQIHALPDTFGQLQNLTKLNLDQNPLVVPPMKIVSKGIEAINDFMVKRSLDRLLGEEQRSIIVGNNQAQTGWLTHSTSWLNNWVSGSDSGGKSPQDSYLEQKL